MKLDKNRRPKKFKNPITKGRVNPTFTHEHSISSKISPDGFIVYSIPFKEKKYSTKQKNKSPSFSLFAKWTNLRQL